MRTIRRVGRSTGAGGALTAGVKQVTKQVEDNIRKLHEEQLGEKLKLIAAAQRKIADLSKVIGERQTEIEAIMKQAKIPEFSDGVLTAAFVDTYSNEKKEIDPQKLFAIKKFPREHFFASVKVQIGTLQEYMAESEIRAIAKITPAKKTGTKLEIKPVKSVVVVTTPSRAKKK